MGLHTSVCITDLVEVLMKGLYYTLPPHLKKKMLEGITDYVQFQEVY
jgi:hypothetical protein